MKAYYDLLTRDYFLLISGAEIKSLLRDTEITCDVYQIKGHEVLYFTPKLIVSTVPDYSSLNNKFKKSIRKRIDFSNPLLFEPGDVENNLPYLLTLTKEWIVEGLDPELFRRCGGNSLRYNNGCEFHFLSDGGHLFDKIILNKFKALEKKWKNKYK